MTQLIEQMNQFRRICKKRKEKRNNNDLKVEDKNQTINEMIIQHG
jgi:hypothetical protein